jgi:hypothetical protein
MTFDKKGQSDNKGPEYQRGSTIAIWIPIGVGFGVALGLAFHNLALGIAIGASIGLAIGLVMDQRRKSMAAQDHGKQSERLLLAMGLLGLVGLATLVFLLLE